MKRNLVLCLVLLFSTIAHAQETFLSGKFRIELDNTDNWVEFLVNKKDEVKVVKSSEYLYFEGGDASRLTVERHVTTDVFGPNSVPYWLVKVSIGSDEETVETTFVLTVTGSFNEKMTLQKLAAWETYSDGPNEYYSAAQSTSDIFIWNKKNKAFELID